MWLDGEQIGEIQQKKLDGARLLFFDAIVPHAVTGKPISLELHTDIQNRVDVIVAFN